VAHPCIKGTAFESVLQDVRPLLASGRLSRRRLASRLDAAHLPLLDQKISPAGWYPIECYAALLEQLCELEGGDQARDYLFRRGEIAAERLHGAGIYPQLDASGAKLGLRVVPLVVSLAGSIYNFTRWSTQVDSDGKGFQVFVDDAAAYPDVARFAAEGFLHWTTERILERRATVSSERTTDDRVVFQVLVAA
jgi:hypothetical protein